MSWDPRFDPDKLNPDWVLQQYELEEWEEEDRQRAQYKAAEERLEKLRYDETLRRATLDQKYSIQDLNRYMAKLTPRERFDLEPLLVRLNIIIPENDSRGIADLGKEYVNKTANLEKTAVDESAEQDLEKYLSKLTSEKREELEDILSKFRKASAKLVELSEKANTKPAPNQLTTVQALICGGLVALIIIFYGIVCYLD